MCGIFGCITYSKEIIDNIEESINKISHRGPDNTTIKLIDCLENGNNILFGFHRLAINGLNENSNQPFIVNGNSLICNGEIFNHKQLEKTYNINVNSDSDCEFILHLYNKLKDIKSVIEQLDAEFAFIIHDKEKNKIFIARDPFGVRPLFIGHNKNDTYFSSELKAIHELSNDIKPFLPGHYMEIDCLTNEQTLIKYHDDDFSKLETVETSIPVIYTNIRKYFTDAVDKRLMSDKSVGCLLSGGLDSSIVSAIVNRLVENKKDIQYFSIGLSEKSVDIIAAKKVIKHFGIDPKQHHIITFTVEEGLDVLEKVIYHLESYDITTIRASVPQYLLAKYIKENTDVKVLFSGEGADELLAGYQYNKSCKNEKELCKDTKRLLRELYMYDNLRTDRTMAAFGLEVRIPFLDKNFTNYIMSLDSTTRMCNDRIEKKLIRDAFNTSDNYLPLEILYRHKEAFSDAVSTKDLSWYKSLCGMIDKYLTCDDVKNTTYSVNKPLTKEALFYRNIFNRYYPNRENIIEHIWMPMWQEEGLTDPSATVLKCHVGDL